MRHQKTYIYIYRRSKNFMKKTNVMIVHSEVD